MAEKTMRAVVFKGPNKVRKWKLLIASKDPKLKKKN